MVVYKESDFQNRLFLKELLQPSKTIAGGLYRWDSEAQTPRREAVHGPQPALDQASRSCRDMPNLKAAVGPADFTGHCPIDAA